MYNDAYIYASGRREIDVIARVPAQWRANHGRVSYLVSLTPDNGHTYYWYHDLTPASARKLASNLPTGYALDMVYNDATGDMLDLDNPPASWHIDPARVYHRHGEYDD